MPLSFATTPLEVDAKAKEVKHTSTAVSWLLYNIDT
jgi:hypothetical protein